MITKIFRMSPFLVLLLGLLLSGETAADETGNTVTTYRGATIVNRSTTRNAVNIGGEMGSTVIDGHRVAGGASSTVSGAPAIASDDPEHADIDAHGTHVDTSGGDTHVSAPGVQVDVSGGKVSIEVPGVSVHTE